MDENGEVKKPEEQQVEGEKKQQPVITSEQKERADKAWDVEFKKREAKGEKITDEERAARRQQVERGRGPIGGGSSDGNFENFDAEKFKDTPLYDLGKELKEAGKNSQVTQETINRMRKTADDLLGVAKIDDDRHHQFINEINKHENAIRTGIPVVPDKKEEAPKISLTDKYKDKPGLLNLARDVENRLVTGGINPRSQEEIMQNLRYLLEREEITPEEAGEFVEDFRVAAGIEPPTDNRKERISRNNITSIQDVAKIIITDEGEDRWGPVGGVDVGATSEAPYPLLEKTGVEGKLRINKANFIQWARERTMYHHNNNPRDLQLALTRLVGIVNDFGQTTSIFSMDENRNRFFKDDESGRILDDLADQLKTEVWLFGNMRNYDLVYKEYMGQDSKLPEFLVNVHNKEELTSSDSLERIMTLSEKFLGTQEDELDENGNKIEKKAQDMKVGDAARKAYEIYYYISDLPKLREILGTNSIFFKKEGLINVFKIFEKIAHTDEIKPEHMKQIDSLFNADGSIKEAEFINFVNPFNDQNKPDTNISIAREMVRQAVAEKYGLEYGLNLKVNEERSPTGKYRAPDRAFRRINTEYAETWAWIMSRFTGAAARNDTNSIGFDAFTKTMQFMKYRIRQSNESRAGQFGNEYNLGVFKTLTLDFFNGVWVQQEFGDPGRKTPFELMMELDEKDRAIEKIKEKLKNPGTELTSDDNEAIKTMEEEKRKLAHKFRFDQSTQKGYATNHIGRAFEIFHNMLGNEELRLDQIVKWEPYMGGAQGRYVIDRTKFEEALKEKFIKPVRYAFSTYPMIDFAKKTQELVSAGSDKKLPVYRETTIAENIFGPIVTGELKKDIVNVKKRLIREKVNKSIRGGKSKKEAIAGLDAREQQLLKQKRFSASDKDTLWNEMLTGPKADLRPILWKRAVMARIAKDLLSHRQRSSNNKYEYFGHEQIELFINALESIPSIVMPEGENHDPDEDLTFEYGEKFLTEEDIHWIREQSETTESKIFKKDIVPQIAGGFMKGIGEGIKDFFKGSFK